MEMWLVPHVPVLLCLVETLYNVLETVAHGVSSVSMSPWSMWMDRSSPPGETPASNAAVLQVKSLVSTWIHHVPHYTAAIQLSAKESVVPHVMNVSMTGGSTLMEKCSSLLEVDPACSAGVRVGMSFAVKKSALLSSAPTPL